MRLGRIHIDPEVDAMNIDVAPGPSSRTEVVAPGIMIDYDEQDRIVGIEVLYVSKRMSASDVRRFEMPSTPTVAEP